MRARYQLDAAEAVHDVEVGSPKPRSLMTKRFKVGQVIRGEPSGMVLLMDFDSADAITSMFDSADYAALVSARHRGFSEMNILVAQEEGQAGVARQAAVHPVAKQVTARESSRDYLRHTIDTAP